MIYINNQEKLDKIKFEISENYYIVADFDNTLTEGSSMSTWGLMSKINGVSEDYIRRSGEYRKYYRPIEIDSTMPDEEKSKYMSEWWQKHIGLFFEYGIREENIKIAVRKNILKFREGAKEFLEDMNNKNVPLIIISAGIGNIIEEFLYEENCYFDNIYILSNFIKFKDGLIEKFDGEIIHALNKNVINLPQKILEKIEKRNNILLLGDGLADLKMIKEDDIEKAITVGFLDEKIEENLEFYNKEYDVVLTDNSSFYDVKKIIKY